MAYNHEELIHCAGYDADCPQTCFKAKITRDYNMYADNYAGLQIKWENFEDRAGCRKADGCPCKTCEKETCVNPLVCDDYIAWAVTQ